MIKKTSHVLGQEVFSVMMQLLLPAFASERERVVPPSTRNVEGSCVPHTRAHPGVRRPRRNSWRPGGPEC